MTDSFREWINSMQEEEYVDRLESEPEDGGFTDNQKELALNIRTPLSEEEEEIYEQEQYYEPQTSIREIEIPSTRIVNKGIITKQEAPAEVKSKSPITITRIIEENRQIPRTGIAPTIPKPSYVVFPRETKPSAIKRFFSLFRRKRN